VGTDPEKPCDELPGEDGESYFMFHLPIALAAVGIFSLADLNRELGKKFEREQSFCVTATVVSAYEDHGKPERFASDRRWLFYVYDGSRYSLLLQPAAEECTLVPGDKVRFDGRIDRERYGWAKTKVEHFLKIGESPVPSPKRCDAVQLQDPDRRLDFVRMEGVLARIQKDDIDPYNAWLFLRSGEGPFVAAVGSKSLTLPGAPSVGDRVELVGRTEPTPHGGRRHFRSASLCVTRMNVLERAPADLFAVPGIDDLDYANAATLERLSLHKTDGRVVAVLPPDQILLWTPSGRCVGATMRDGPLPKAGDVVSVAGFPTTDMFILRLESAVWRSSQAVVDDVPPVQASAKEILSIDRDEFNAYAEYYGRRVRLRGRVLEANSGGETLLTLESDGFLVAVRVDDTYPPEWSCRLGSGVEVAGTCILDTEPWSARNLMPKVRGIELFVARPDDIRVLSEPSWWTVRRTIFVALGFSAVILLSLLCVMLRAHVVKRRARAKALERTRLAAEIHDSLSQNLSGVAGQIAAVRRALVVRPEVAGEYLERAERMLSSSRTELQRCLFDLRNTALEEANLGEAVRRTVEPLLGSVGLHLRFNVSRSKIGDSALHAVLCIARELVSNSIVHGQAANVRISGALDEEALRFSVSDDGCGFDVSRAPGVSEGHFGLQGIRERLNCLGGAVSFDSVAPHGCSVTIVIPRKGICT